MNWSHLLCKDKSPTSQRLIGWLSWEGVTIYKIINKWWQFYEDNKISTIFMIKVFSYQFCGVSSLRSVLGKSFDHRITKSENLPVGFEIIPHFIQHSACRVYPLFSAAISIALVMKSVRTWLTLSWLHSNKAVKRNQVLEQCGWVWEWRAR